MILIVNINSALLPGTYLFESKLSAFSKLKSIDKNVRYVPVYTGITDKYADGFTEIVRPESIIKRFKASSVHKEYLDLYSEIEQEFRSVDNLLFIDSFVRLEYLIAKKKMEASGRLPRPKTEINFVYTNPVDGVPTDYLKQAVKDFSKIVVKLN